MRACVCCVFVLFSLLSGTKLSSDLIVSSSIHRVVCQVTWYKWRLPRVSKMPIALLPIFYKKITFFARARIPSNRGLLAKSGKTPSPATLCLCVLLVVLRESRRVLRILICPRTHTNYYHTKNPQAVPTVQSLSQEQHPNWIARLIDRILS